MIAVSQLDAEGHLQHLLTLEGLPAGVEVTTSDVAGALGQHAHRSDAVVVAPCAQLPDVLTDLAAGLRAEPGTEVALVLDDAGAAHAAVPARRGRAAQILAGDALAEYRVGGRSWRIPVGGFWQAHPAAVPTSKPPRRTSVISSIGSTSRGQPTRLIATTGSPPIA